MRSVAKKRSIPKPKTLTVERKEKVPVLKVRKNATLRDIYAKARGAFTAADLQRFTELDDGIQVEQVIAEVESIHRNHVRKRSTTPDPARRFRRSPFPAPRAAHANPDRQTRLWCTSESLKAVRSFS